jgi:hypothetical protein
LPAQLWNQCLSLFPFRSRSDLDYRFSPIWNLQGGHIPPITLQICAISDIIVKKITPIDHLVTFVVVTLHLLGYYFGTKLYQREQYIYDPESIEIPICPHRRRLGDQFCGLCSRFSIDAASGPAAPAARGYGLRPCISFDAAAGIAASAARWKGLRADIALDAAAGSAAAAARWKGLRLYLALDAAAGSAAPAAGWKGLRLAA